MLRTSPCCRHLEILGGNAHIFCDALHLLTRLESLVMSVSAHCKCSFDFLTSLKKLTALDLTISLPEGPPLSLSSLHLPFDQLQTIPHLQISLPKGGQTFGAYYATQYANDINSQSVLKDHLVTWW